MNATPTNDVFHFDNLELDTHIRVIIRDSVPLFVAKDVCACLGLNNSRQALAGLDDDEKGVINSDTLGGNQQVAFVNESGLYALVFKSRKEAARRFRKWVTSEVLPALRQRRAVQSLPSWLESMNYLVGQGAPPDLAKVAALVQMGVEPTTAAKLSMPRTPRETKSTPEIESLDFADEDHDPLFLSHLNRGQEFSFAELVDIANHHKLFGRILEAHVDKKGKLTPAGCSAFGLRLGRIAKREAAFRIIGRGGRNRRYLLMPE